VEPVVIAGVGAAGAASPPVSERRVGGSKLIEVGAATVRTPRLVVAPLADGLVRLTVGDVGEGAREVTLFTSDDAEAVLASQVVRAAPYTAVLARGPRVVSAGVTVRYADGATATSTVPIAALR
jgi:hypothetical protein